MRWRRWQRAYAYADELFGFPVDKARWIHKLTTRRRKVPAPPKQVWHWLKAAKLKVTSYSGSTRYIKGRGLKVTSYSGSTRYIKGRGRMWRLTYNGQAWTLQASARYAAFDRWANSHMLTECIPDNHEAFVELVMTMCRYATAKEMVND